MESRKANSAPLAAGERVSLRVGDREVIGFVTRLDDDTVDVIDRRGQEHHIARAAIVAGRRVRVSLGRDPLAAPTALLDALAERAGASGDCWVIRISALLVGRTPPASVAAWGPRASFAGMDAHLDGEWVTLATGDLDAIVAAAWWATRAGARSVQVRTSDAAGARVLEAAGFVRHHEA